MLPRRLLPWLFALTLLLGQAAAFAHTLHHLHAHDPGLPDKVCEVCVAQVQLGSALPPSLVSLTLPATDCIVATGVTPFWVDLAPCPGCARAPPASSDV